MRGHMKGSDLSLSTDFSTVAVTNRLPLTLPTFWALMQDDYNLY